MDEERRMYAKELQEELSALRMAVTASTAQSAALETVVVEHGVLLKEHDKILVRGNGVPSMQETVRLLERLVTEFVSQYRRDKEEETRARAAKDKEDSDRRYAEKNRWKWTVIAIVLGSAPVVISFIYEFVVFWRQIVPLLESKI